VARYRGKFSGPLLDRIDIHIEVPAVPQEELTRESAGESSAAVRRRVVAARTYHRVLKLARTIADLAAVETIAASHIAGAIGYRRQLEVVR
jgi:magnesium chelatase family protein